MNGVFSKSLPDNAGLFSGAAQAARLQRAKRTTQTERIATSPAVLLPLTYSSRSRRSISQRQKDLCDRKIH
ncbi:hypothetical protein RMSM_07180 [Rhodopirellula maiorica SM1]|uniref:Uncharacterized protein n=1 Tax=Rhodopirellula maiorica SM1 TaxID=1265738 RepID=M5R8S9_9BACT|nr:hypothetical protein RMSM_07180 [Rhodopirellula maiorica SM1]